MKPRKTDPAFGNSTIGRSRWSRTRLLPFAGPACLALSLILAACTDHSPQQPIGHDSPVFRCTVCHSFEKDGPFRVAPNLYGIVGAPKARDRAWYSYSHGLIEKGGTWTPQELDAFLSNPDKFAPGTAMNIRVTDPEERKRIIEFLETLKD